ncbi:galactose oxidase-like domain-containing protein [Nocardia sp. NPDC059764]|uniref:galactose oxidase-like domain-containing protein n=1 Tax=Nocardia sp. NPDC059764 TaxID=3346939 RepID=UPI00365948EB
MWQDNSLSCPIGPRVTIRTAATPSPTPPGWYLVAVVDADGVPSVGQWPQPGVAAPSLGWPRTGAARTTVEA